MTSRTGSVRRILRDLKKSGSWVESCLRRRRLAFACSRRPCDGCARVGGGRWKSHNRKNVYLSPYVKEPLNSKVIKSFVPELRSRKCFSCFEIPMFYVYMLWTLYVRFTHSHIMTILRKHLPLESLHAQMFLFASFMRIKSQWSYVKMVQMSYELSELILSFLPFCSLLVHQLIY